jgi:uncharacterized protein YbaA (DUF1428 family)
MTYVDGFVFPIPKKNLASYRKMAEIGKKTWLKHGALQYFECIGEDLNPPTPEGMESMKGITFPKLVKARAGETVGFSFIMFKSRAHRDAVNKKVMKDPYMNDPKNMPKTMPFDMKRMSYGGFKAFVEK